MVMEVEPLSLQAKELYRPVAGEGRLDDPLIKVGGPLFGRNMFNW